MTAKEKLIKRLKDRLAVVRAEIDAQVQNGSAYNLSGSHSKTSVAFDKLRSEETALVLRIARLGGGRRTGGMTTPAFNT